MNQTTAGFDELPRLRKENQRLRARLRRAGIDAAAVTGDAAGHAERIAFTRADFLASEADRALYAAIIESATDFAIIATDVDGRVTLWNEGAARILGWSEEEMEGNPLSLIFTPDDQKAGIEKLEMRRAIKSGRADDERWHVRKDGSLFFANGSLMPLYSDEDGDENADAIGFLKIFQDETPQHSMRGQLADSRERLDAALRTGLVGFFDWNVSTGIISSDAEFGSYFGRGADVMAAGVPFTELTNQLPQLKQFREREEQSGSAANQPDYISEFSVEHDGKVRWMLIRASCTERAEGRPVRYLGVAIDITRQKQIEAERQMLARELQHRVKNMLAVVQSIANQTFRHIKPEMAAAFSARIGALSSAQDILTETSWRAAPITSVLEHVLAPHGRDRFEFYGPEYDLSDRQVLSLSLGLHELATNAAKYGALSDRQGRIRIEWATKEGFHLRWIETGGPAVTTPIHKGFGSRLMERSLASEFGGTATFDYRPEGLIVTIDAPRSP